MRKNAGERRAELLNFALALFFEKGYEATTINDILERAGVSKGAFYHHFTSKEELLDAFTSALAGSIVGGAKDVLADTSLSEVARLNRFLESSGRIQYESEPAPAAVFASLFKPENARLYERIMAVGAKTITPVLSEIVERGVRKGEFDVPDTEIVVQMLVQLAAARFPVIVEAVQMARGGDMRRAVRILDKRIIAEQKLLERILGLAAGSIAIYQPDYARVALNALAGPAKAPSARRKQSPA